MTAADLAHGRDTPAAAISERTGHICGRTLAMLDTAVHATQTLGAESTRPNRKNQLLARPTTPELRALRTLTQLRTQIADISPYYGRADHAGIDALAVDAHSPGLAGDLRRWHDSAIAQLTARDTPSLRLPAGDLTTITVASARLVDIAAAAGIITAQNDENRADYRPDWEGSYGWDVPQDGIARVTLKARTGYGAKIVAEGLNEPTALAILAAIAEQQAAAAHAA